MSFKPENFDQLREGNLPARDIAPLPERVWFNLSSLPVLQEISSRVQVLKNKETK